MNALELVALAKRLVSDKGNRVWGSDPEALEHVQVASLKVHGHYSAIDEGYGQLDKDYSWVTPNANTGEAEYKLPRNCETVKAVALLNSSGTVLQLAVPHDMVELMAREVTPWYAYHFRRNNLVLTCGTAGSSISTVRLHYFRSPPELAVFQPTGVSGQTITMPSAPYNGLGKILAYDDAYKGDLFEVVQGPGVGEVYEIVSYTASTRAAVVYSGTTVTATASSTLSVLPSIPTRAQPIISYMAAMDGARIEENLRAYRVLDDETKNLWKSIENTLSARQVQAARAVQSAYD